MRGLIGICAVMGGLVCLSLAHLGAHTRITTTVTWEREISPIVQTRCASCHSPGGRAPMSLATYEAARPWARAIRHEVITRQMPKWHAARGFGEFINDPSLSPFEIQLIVAWVDGGAPKSLPGSVAPGLVFSHDDLTSDLRRHREETMRCMDSPLPTGRLVGLRPSLDAGGSARLTALLPDGQREILGWFRNFDPDFAPTYMLRTPLTLPAGSRLVGEVASSRSCSVVLWLE